MKLCYAGICSPSPYLASDPTPLYGYHESITKALVYYVNTAIECFNNPAYVYTYIPLIP